MAEAGRTLMQAPGQKSSASFLPDFLVSLEAA
jgi:hypothetical protein